MQQRRLVYVWADGDRTTDEVKEHFASQGLVWVEDGPEGIVFAGGPEEIDCAALREKVLELDPVAVAAEDIEESVSVEIEWEDLVDEPDPWDYLREAPDLSDT